MSAANPLPLQYDSAGLCSDLLDGGLSTSGTSATSRAVQLLSEAALLDTPSLLDTETVSQAMKAAEPEHAADANEAKLKRPRLNGWTLYRKELFESVPQRPGESLRDRKNRIDEMSRATWRVLSSSDSFALNAHAKACL